MTNAHYAPARGKKQSKLSWLARRKTKTKRNNKKKPRGYTLKIKDESR
jgi:hypothetical protein